MYDIRIQDHTLRSKCYEFHLLWLLCCPNQTEFSDNFSQHFPSTVCLRVYICFFSPRFFCVSLFLFLSFPRVYVTQISCQIQHSIENATQNRNESIYENRCESGNWLILFVCCSRLFHAQFSFPNQITNNRYIAAHD